MSKTFQPTLSIPIEEHAMADYKLVTFQTSDGARAGALLGEQIFDAAKLSGNPAHATMLAVLRDWRAAHGELRKAKPGTKKGIPLRKAKLLAPVPNPGAVYCAGANYTDHMAEMARAQNREPGPTMKERGEKPWHFIKTSRSSIVGPDTTVKLPSYSQAVDWEVELVAVIGRKAKDLPGEKGLGCVAGYTIANDLSARDVMRREKNPPTSPFHYGWGRP